MDINGLLLALGIVALSMYIIKYACDSFEGASDYLGTEVYKMKPGIRGATLEAIASSLPELFTASFLLFLWRGTPKAAEGFSAAVATCAGSAVFNAAVIPAVCILAVSYKGVNGQKISEIPIMRKTVLRDGFFFVLAEIVLIIFLGNNTLAWWMGAGLIGIYAIYFGVLMRGFGNEDEDEDDEDEDEEEENGDKSLFGNLVTFDFNSLFFGGQEFNARRAWIVLSLATATIGAACFGLTHAIEMSAEALDIPMYFTAVILGAAATSVPDTFISYADAMKGDYDDAVANAVGSNIFDICVALGLPLMVYGLVYGSVTLSGELGDAANIQELRIALIIVTFVILGLLLSGRSGKNSDGEVTVSVGAGRAWVLVSLYVLWTVFIIGRAFELPFITGLMG
jgi:Ca2+/Na+ antiporter